MHDNIVLIVGAGPTGLTLAVDLARRGTPFRLIEAAPTPFEGSRGKGIQPRTLEIFDDLGIIEPILAAGALYPKFRTHAGPFSLRAGSLAPFRPPTESVPYPNVWMLPQSRTEAILRERLCALGAVVEFGKALTTFTQNERGVDATLSTGENVRCDLLVGADGGRSGVRRTLGLRLEGETVEEKTMIVADLEIEDLDRRDWHLWPFAKGGMIALCPLPNTSLFQFTAKAETAKAGIEDAVRRATGHRVARIAWSSTYQPAVRMVDRYRVGRAFLAGDAAHMHPPAGGQGLNTGVQDAYNLGWKLAHVMRGGPDSLLDTYEAERLPVAAVVLGLSKRLHQTRSIKRGDATNLLALNYRASPLSSGAALGTLHPGDRMPDLQLDDGGRLFDRLRGPHATELVTPEGPGILIRPDGYIAHIGATRCDEYAGAPTHRLHLSLERLIGEDRR
ncbi:FAD-dependent monooxygenase [Methylocapsa sp. S129]|uniref:FAD-dependent monooxygenase n=1 Tax=Methylocapsa sp. S129 TaxID=1641869 RepID=UPI001FEDC3F6|nr:FAD-dependent monooxygenase [Methylocapsa sp. S129]